MDVLSGAVSVGVGDGANGHRVVAGVQHFLQPSHCCFVGGPVPYGLTVIQSVASSHQASWLVCSIRRDPSYGAAHRSDRFLSNAEVRCAIASFPRLVYMASVRGFWLSALGLEQDGGGSFLAEVGE